MAEILLIFYKDLMTRYSQAKARPEIRLVGHSLGTQLTLALNELLVHQHPELLPDRISLLDPFWSTGKKSYLKKGTKTNVEQCLEVVQKLLAQKKIPIDMYRTSALGSWYFFGDKSEQLRQITAFREWKEHGFTIFNFKQSHLAGIPFYFTSFGQKTAQLSAATPAAVVLKQMGF